VGAAMRDLVAAADRIDYWIRRHEFQHWREFITLLGGARRGRSRRAQ
jgi:hypothetical protein